jgi:cell division GTPase FtsZ
VSQASSAGGITRYAEVGHAIVKRTKEKKHAAHSSTNGGHPTAAGLHNGSAPAGGKPQAADARHFIANAIKRPGALTAAVGGKPSKKKGKVRNLARTGTPLQRRQANFYLNVLAKAKR